jgi:hypothetical protein
MYFLTHAPRRVRNAKWPATGLRIRLDLAAASIAAESVLLAKSDSPHLRKIEAKIRINPIRIRL